MRIEELMPQIRAGKKVRCKSWSKGDFMHFVENMPSPSAMDEHGAYTGFIAMSSGTEYIFGLSGEDMMGDDWELYNEPAQPI